MSCVKKIAASYLLKASHYARSIPDRELELSLLRNL